MNINILREKLKKGEIIILDGATGSELTARGVKTDLPLWSAEALLTHPEVVKQIHKDYLEAGAQIITTNTFRTNTRTFEKKELTKDQAKEATILACKLVREAIEESGKQAWVMGEIAPLEDCYTPSLVPPLSELQKEHLENVEFLKEGGADFIAAETMIKIEEVVTVSEEIQKAGLSVAVSFCCNDKNQLLSGESLEDAVKAVEKFNPLFIALNCMEAKLITKTLKHLKTLTNIPLGAYAQGAGEVDDKVGWVGGGAEAINDYLEEVKEWIKLGVQVIGSCCGTNPEYISQIKNMTTKMQTSQKEVLS